MLLSIVLAIGAAVGFGGGYTCFKAQLEVQKIEHKEELAEAWAEVFRLRTQVALHIGDESSTAKAVKEIRVALHQNPSLI